METTSDNITDGSCMSLEDDNCGIPNNAHDEIMAIMPENNVSSEDMSNPYSYLNRGDYTSEAYKLELMNLPKRFGIAVSYLCSIACYIINDINKLFFIKCYWFMCGVCLRVCRIYFQSSVWVGTEL